MGSQVPVELKDVKLKHTLVWPWVIHSLGFSNLNTGIFFWESRKVHANLPGEITNIYR